MGEDTVEPSGKGLPHDWFVVPAPDVAASRGDFGVIFQIIEDNNDVGPFFTDGEAEISLVKGATGKVGLQKKLVRGSSL